MRNDILQRHFVASAQIEGKLAIIIAGFDAQQRGSYRHDGHRDAAGSQTPQADGALLADLGMGRHALHGDHIERGQELRTGCLAAADQQRVKRLDRFEEFFGALVAIDHDDQRAFGELPEQYGVNGFGGGVQPAERELAAGGDAPEQFLECRVTAQVEEQVTYGRVNHEQFECNRGARQGRAGDCGRAPADGRPVCRLVHGLCRKARTSGLEERSHFLVTDFFSVVYG